jgi:lysophospholipase L1-like esterase
MMGIAEFTMPFVWFCASGNSFFLGSSLTILAVVISVRRTGPFGSTLISALVITGFLLIVFAAMPFSVAFYASMVISVAIMLFCVGARRAFKIARGTGRVIILFLCVAGIIRELSFQPAVNLLDDEPLYVIGDSVSAGIGGPSEMTWPRVLADKYAVEVVNFAKPGATVASASEQAKQIGDGPGFIFLEIGGNDLFAPTPPTQFRKDLAQLLEKVVHPNRTIAMLELPLFPWDIEYGRIQRELARSFNVALIPKRFFVNILRESGSTLDLAHLSAQGHQRMADQVANLLGITKHLLPRTLL